MTTATMALAELAEKGADVDVLRQMVQFMAQRLMELDVEGRCGAGYDEKNPERLNSRNGYRDRTWDTRAGSVELKIPKLRQGSYFPECPRRLNSEPPCRLNIEPGAGAGSELLGCG
jgi:putative transposase